MARPDSFHTAYRKALKFWAMSFLEAARDTPVKAWHGPLSRHARAGKNAVTSQWLQLSL